MIESRFVAAAKAGVLCELTDGQGRFRIVEPYMVYESSRGKRLFHCYQIDGYSESGKPAGWKNPEVFSFSAARVTQTSFRQRPEYNPANERMFPVIYFALKKAMPAVA